MTDVRATHHVNLILSSLCFALLQSLQCLFSSVAKADQLSDRDMLLARNTLRAALPDEHGEYTVRRTYVSKQERRVVFERAMAQSHTRLNRRREVQCWIRHDSPWYCNTPPSVIVEIGEHSFFDIGIDDETIIAIVEYVQSPCLRDQAERLQKAEGKWKAPPLSIGPLPIRNLKRGGTVFTVLVGLPGFGHTLSVIRPKDLSPTCPFELIFVGTYISEVPSPYQWWTMPNVRSNGRANSTAVSSKL